MGQASRSKLSLNWHNLLKVFDMGTEHRSRELEDSSGVVAGSNARPAGAEGVRPESHIVRERVSILIPSYVRPDDLEHTLGETVKQNYHDVEILVVDDSTPGNSIRDAVAKFPNVRYEKTLKNDTVARIPGHSARALCKVLVVWNRVGACCSRSRSNASLTSIAR